VWSKQAASRDAFSREILDTMTATWDGLSMKNSFKGTPC